MLFTSFIGVWKCLASKLKTNVATAGNDLPITYDTFCRKWNAKAVSSKVQVPPLLHQCYNAALRLLYKSAFGPRKNLSLRPLHYLEFHLCLMWIWLWLCMFVKSINHCNILDVISNSIPSERLVFDACAFMQFPYQAPSGNQPVRALKCMINIRKDSLRLIRYVTNSL